MGFSAPIVLLLDDDDGLRLILETALLKHGYRVITASRGQEGLHLARRTHFDLVITDLLMPDVSGLLVLEILKSSVADSLPVLLMSGAAGEHLRAYACCLGAADFLLKPFSLENFLRTVERICPLRSPADSLPEPAATTRHTPTFYDF